MASRGIRLDSLLVKKGLFLSRSKAQGAILAGHIYVEGQRVQKAGTPVFEEAAVEYRGKEGYVSRGGLKLEGALHFFQIYPIDLVVLDLGASTGGFTHCLLQFGARKVYAVDVGYNQLDYSLRIHDQVVVKERINARYLTPGDFPHLFPLITMDLSFISLTRVLPAAERLLYEKGKILALLKPQFEAGKGRVGKKGVVRDLWMHQEILLDIMAFSQRLNLIPSGLMVSPLQGKKEQNIEYFLYLIKDGEEQDLTLRLQEVYNEVLDLWK